jgi:hypothetical protein
MSDPLIKYIREQIQAGYNINVIKTHLIKNGYNLQDVDSAINTIYHPEITHHVHHVSKGTIISIAVIGMILALLMPTVYFYLSGSSQPLQLLDIRTSTITLNPKSGDKIEFNIELSNMGKSKRYDVFLKHEILNTDIYMEETIAVETSTSKKTSIQLPKDIAPKRYTLRTTATYEDKKAFSTLQFDVISDNTELKCIEDWNCGEWMPQKCPSSSQQTRTCSDKKNCGTFLYKPETTRSCTYQQEIQPTPPKKEDSSLTIWEQLDNIKELAKTDHSKAASDCGKLEIESHRDECYYNVAEVSLILSRCDNIISDRTKDKCINNIAKLTNNNALCENIEKDTRRKDSCYMNFVNMGDYTVCDKIENSYLKEACEALRDMPDLVVS